MQTVLTLCHAGAAHVEGFLTARSIQGGVVYTGFRLIRGSSVDIPIVCPNSVR